MGNLETGEPVDGELAALRKGLAEQRRHVLGILDGLDAISLRRPVLPSGWSCAGLVAHLTIDVERFWFRAVLGGHADLAEPEVDAWHVPADANPHAILDAYRTEIAEADREIERATAAAGAAGAAPLAWWPDDLFGDWRLTSVRQLLIHVITETACHAGHLDAARELLDGHRWMVLSPSGVPV